VDSHQELRADVNVLRTSSIDTPATKPAKAEEQEHANNESLLEFTRSIKNCGDQLKVLTEALADITDKFKQTHDDVIGLTETLHKTKTDLDNWYSSSFFDEDSGRIKDIHEIVTGSVIRFYDDEHDKSIPKEFQAPAALRVIEEQQAAIPEPVAKPVAQPSQRFRWPNPSKVSLKSVVTNNMPISVCLITDSIMRHINEMEFAQYRVDFSRIDRTDIVPGLSLEKMRRKLLELQPHLIYLHLGINDIHRGTPVSEAMVNFANFHEFLLEKLPGTKMIVSLPLLNGRAFQYRIINQLRRSLTQYIGTHSGPSMDVRDRKLFLQRNMNFVEYDGDGLAAKSNERFYDTAEDGVHLNNRGKEAITCAMRASLDRILKEHRAATA
jgi:lysophospholipase L1-like esterase